MGITGVVGSYETFYGGDPNRIHNVQLVAHLVDGKLIAPGATFSFNQATGERSASKGFLEAPVIINGELQTGLGGGVCQVSTTVFNAAYEAGLPITARTNHALYISHYPLGRDATVNYPDVDLKFVNDTPHWLLLRTFVGSSSLVVTLYGAPQHRRVVSEAAPLKVVSPPPVQKKLDPSLAPGTSEVQDPGESAYSTSVHRLVYAPTGSSSPTRPGTRTTSLARDPARRAEAEAQAEAEAKRRRRLRRRRRQSSPGAAIAAASQSGIRVGRSVSASTVACAVQPSAITSPSRSIAYSNRKRAPRTSRQRVWTSSRSSKTAGAMKRACDSSTNDSMPESRSRW